MIGTRLHRQLVLDHVLVQERRFAGAKDEHQDIQRRFVRMEPIHGGKRHVDERQGDVVFHRDIARCRQTHDGLLRHRHFRAARYGTEILHYPSERLGAIEVAADGERGVVGAVPAQKELLQIVHIDAVQILHVADHGPRIGMPFWIQRLPYPLEQQAVGAVVHALSALVLHRVALHLELLLGHRVQQKAHAVGFQPKHLFQLIAGNGLEVVGAIGVGGAVQGAAGFRDDLEVLLVADVGGTLEHHVLEEMREAGFADLLASGADVIGDIHVHQRVRTVFVQDDDEAVVQTVLGVRNDHLVAGLAGQRFQLRHAGGQLRYHRACRWWRRRTGLLTANEREQRRNRTQNEVFHRIAPDCPPPIPTHSTAEKTAKRAVHVKLD